jgi:hypothetical protein
MRINHHPTKSHCHSAAISVLCAPLCPFLVTPFITSPPFRVGFDLIARITTPNMAWPVCWLLDSHRTGQPIHQMLHTVNFINACRDVTILYEYSNLNITDITFRAIGVLDVCSPIQSTCSMRFNPEAPSLCLHEWPSSNTDTI